ncbi:MAG: hypothetical protein ABL911_13060 [Gallionella sp.]
MVSLNAAYAASLTVCDAVKHVSDHGLHIGHHDHADEQAHHDLQVNGGETDETSSVNAHYHHHVHPSFSCILPSVVGLVELDRHSLVTDILPQVFVSAALTPLDHPPKTILA